MSLTKKCFSLFSRLEKYRLEKLSKARSSREKQIFLTKKFVDFQGFSARVAQWKSRSLLSLRSWVQFPPRAPYVLKNSQLDQKLESFYF